MDYSVNNTSNYHLNELETLGWEMTLCNMLEGDDNPCRKILGIASTFGKLLYKYLRTLIPISSVRDIIEIGGGYGYLMRDFLTANPCLKPVMLDLSPFLLEKQRETLKDYPVTYLNKDFFNTDSSFLKGFQLALLNEIIGDFPALCNVDPALFSMQNNEPDPVIGQVKELFMRYSITDIPDTSFNINLGAIEAVEKLCMSGIPNIYLSEHSCEASAPEGMKGKIHLPSGNYPRRIMLKGHDEYTIKFSYLERVASFYNYSIIRGQYRDFIPLNESGEVNFILTSNSQKDTHEAVRQFIEDLFAYEYLILIKE